MATLVTSERDPEGLAFDRIVFFSDAVWAIAITLLVIEIKPPHIGAGAGPHETLNALRRIIPQLVGYLISFAVLSMFWVEHHRIFRCIKVISHKALWRNMMLLMAVALVPFPTALFSEHYTNTTVVVLYACTLAGVGALKLWFWLAVRKQELNEHAAGNAEFIKLFVRRTWAVTLSCVLVAVWALMSDNAYIGFILTPIASWASRKWF